MSLRVLLLGTIGLYCWSHLIGLGTAAQLQIGQNFIGSRSGTESEAVPADTMGAAGLEHFVEFINGRFAVYEKSTGKRVQSKTDIQFWNAAGVTFSSTV